MLNLYKCERCGKLFDGENAYEECRKHEQMHYTPADIYDIENKPDEYRQLVIHSIVYDDKQLEPSSFIAFMKQEYWDEEGHWHTDMVERRYKLTTK